MENKQPTNKLKISNKYLKFSTNFWFVVMLIGQWIFVTYLIYSYAFPALQEGFISWNKLRPNVYVEGESINNIAFIFHILISVIIIGGGPLQLIPKLRNKFPIFHRWLGRVYVSTSIITSIAGLILVWSKGTVGDLSMHIGISGDAILIFIFSYFTWKFALQRKMNIHKRWAIRLYLVVSAVWFYRVLLMFWVFVNGGPVGFDFETFTGPFLTFISFGQYLLPLLVYELYLFTKRKNAIIFNYITSIILLLSSIVLSIGIFIATVGMWFPQ